MLYAMKKKKQCFHFSFACTIELAAALLKTIATFPNQVINLSLYDTEEEFPDAAADEPCAADEQPRPFGSAD